MSTRDRLGKLEGAAFMTRAQFEEEARAALQVLLEIVRDEVRDPAALERIAVRMRDGLHSRLPT